MGCPHLTDNKAFIAPYVSRCIAFFAVYLLPVFLLTDSLLFADGPLMGVHIAETSDPTHYQNKVTASEQLGIKVVRVPVDWIALQPASDNFSAAYIDVVKSRVAFIQANSQQAVMMFSQSPAWANGGNGPSFPPLSTHYQDYADAMAFLHGELIDPNDDFQIDASGILAWEVWNEPNSTAFWSTHSARSGTFVLVELSAAIEYAALLGISYDKMKSLHPNVTILGGSLASADTEYLQAMYDFWGGSPKFDHLSLHPYTRVDDESGDPVKKSQYPDQCNASDPLAPPWCYKQGVENIRQLLDSNGDDTKQIWFTEFGTSSSAEWGNAGSEAEQKEHMKRALDILKDWFLDNDAMKIPVAITYRLEDQDLDLFGLYAEGLANTKPVADEYRQRIDPEGKLLTDDGETPETPEPPETPETETGETGHLSAAGGGGVFELFWLALILLAATALQRSTPLLNRHPSNFPVTRLPSNPAPYQRLDGAR